jgi:hypothetical protein
VLILFYVFTGIFFCPINLFPCFYPIEHSVKFLSLPEKSRRWRRYLLRSAYPIVSFLMTIWSDSLSELITFWTGLFGPIITLLYPALLYYASCRLYKVPYNIYVLVLVVLLWLSVQIFCLIGSYYSVF